MPKLIATYYLVRKIINISKLSLIPEQSPGETNPLFQTVINPQPPHSAWAGQ